MNAIEVRLSSAATETAILRVAAVETIVVSREARVSEPSVKPAGSRSSHRAISEGRSQFGCDFGEGTLGSETLASRLSGQIIFDVSFRTANGINRRD